MNSGWKNMCWKTLLQSSFIVQNSTWRGVQRLPCAHLVPYTETDFSGHLLACQKRALQLWSPKMTPRSRCRSLGGSGLCSRFQRLPPAQLCSCPQAEETTAFPWHNRNKVPIKIAGTRSASFYFFQAVLGLSSSSRPSFFASIVPQMFSKVAWDCVRR